jgi:hypothetical protein
MLRAGSHDQECLCEGRHLRIVPMQHDISDLLSDSGAAGLARLEYHPPRSAEVEI